MRNKAFIKLIYLTSALCIGLASCQKDADLQQIEEEIASIPELKEVAAETSVPNDTVLLPDYDAAIEIQRALFPRASQSTTDDENRGEKGRDRRDGNIGWYDGFDADAPLARLKLESIDEATGTITLKIVFGPYFNIDEIIKEKFEGRLVEAYFRDSSQKLIEVISIQDFHVGDTFIVPAAAYGGCYSIRIMSGYLIPHGSHILYMGDQPFETIYQ